jgi:hypothetical protein
MDLVNDATLLQVSSILKHLNSVDNYCREDAEKRLDQLRKESPDTFLANLVAICSHGDTVAVS